MAQPNQFTFDFKELATALVKEQGIHEGLWGVYIEFGFTATNLNTDPSQVSLTPAVINIVQKIGIQRFAESNNLTIDAAEVNPTPKATSGARNAGARKLRNS